MSITSVAVPFEGQTKMPWYKKLFYTIFADYVGLIQPVDINDPEYYKDKRQKALAKANARLNKHEIKKEKRFKKDLKRLLKEFLSDYSKGRYWLSYEHTSPCRYDYVTNLSATFNRAGLKTQPSREETYSGYNFYISIPSEDFIIWYEKHGKSFMKEHNIHL